MLLLAAFLLVGCGAFSTKPIQNFKMVAGRWDGNLIYQASEYGTTTMGATWIIKEDGTFVMRMKHGVARGTMRLEGGNILFFDGPMASGIASLHEGPDGRYLTSTSDEVGTFGSWTLAK